MKPRDRWQEMPGERLKWMGDQLRHISLAFMDSSGEILVVAVLVFLTAVIINSAVLRSVTPCSPVDVN
jgi:hypothetical protein